MSSSTPSIRLYAPLVLVALAAGAFAVAPAQARIVPEERRIGKVELFMSERALRDKLGAPDKIKRIRFDLRRFVYRDKKLRVDINRKTVWQISTRNKRQKTRTGVGVGSSRDRVERDAGDDVRCEDDFKEGDCLLYPKGKFHNDPTWFRIKDGRVVEVIVREGPRPL